MRTILKESLLILVPESDEEREALASWKEENADNVLVLQGDSGNGAALQVIGNRADIGQEPIDVRSGLAETVMSGFHGEYRWLSNFWPVPVVFQRREYPSVEHAYQAAKTKDPNERQLIREAESAGQAKRLGARVTVRKDWDDVKLGVMEDLLRQKFANGALRLNLLNTESVELIEENTWGDRFWGVCRGTGENHLGKLLMKIRSELASVDK